MKNYLKSFILFGILTVAFCAPGQAELEQGNQFLKIFGGGADGLGTLGKKVKPGTLFGASYRYHLASRFSLGPELSYTDFRETGQAGAARYNIDILSLGGFLRFDFMPDDSFHPYTSVGAAHNKINVLLAQTTTEYKTSANQTGVFIGLGFDFEYAEQMMWGMEARYQHLGSNEDALSLTLSADFKLFE